MNVSVSESLATPASSRYPWYWPRTTFEGLTGSIDRNTLFFSSLMAKGSSAVGGSITTNAITWNKWVTTMSLYAPVSS